MQNLVFVNIRTEQARELVEELRKIGLHVEGTQFWRGAIACTGTEFCKLAISETKGFTKWLVEELEDRLPGFDQQIKLHVTGCPNGCGQHWIADIGLEGKKAKYDGEMVDAYNFSIGGALGQHAGVGRVTGYRARASEVPAAIERLLRGYLADRAEGENLRSWFARQDVAELRAHLEGVRESVEVGA
jgi:sulfite reductase (ferredoxin)